MAATSTSKSGRERRPDHKRRIYINPTLWEAVENVIAARKGGGSIRKLERETVSGIITKKLKAHVRQHAPLLRKHSFTVPPEVFE